MSYVIEIIAPARRTLPKLPRDLRERLRAEIRALATEPRPHGYGPLTLLPGHFRVRVGDWRIIYRIDEAAQRVTIVEIMPRQDDYRPR